MTPERLGSRYLLEERVGEGGLGIVWRGRDAEAGTVYAIKVLKPEFAQDEATVSRFVRERTALLRFRHPHVVTLHDMIVEGDKLALVMDFIANGDLSAHRKRRGGALPLPEATELTAQVCAALAAAHDAGIVHRDLKPANVLLDGQPGQAGQARLTDFGIARVTGEPTVTTQGYFLGTLAYAAPEVIQGKEPTPACDVYAAAVTLYELLAGQPPFTGAAAAIIYEHLQGTPRRPAGIPDSVWALIAAGMDKDPGRRPSAAEVESALRSATMTSGVGAVQAPGGLGRAENWAPVASGNTPGQVAALVGSTTPAAMLGVAGPAAPAAPSVPPSGEPVTSGRRVVEAWSSPAWPTEAARNVADLGATGVIGGTGVAGGGGGHRGKTSWRRVGRSGRPRRNWVLSGIVLLVALVVAGFVAGRTLGSSSPVATSLGPVAGTASSTATSLGTPGSTVTGTPTSAAAGSVADGAPTQAASTAPATAAPTAVPTAASAPATQVAASSTVPSNTSWTCSQVEDATLYSTGADTGQTLQSCIRRYNGEIEIKGILTPTVASWHEQIVLVLKDRAQEDAGTYTSGVCTVSDCVFTMTVPAPGAGDWTVLPEWDRLNGNYQSTGHEPGYVTF